MICSGLVGLNCLLFTFCTRLPSCVRLGFSKQQDLRPRRGLPGPNRFCQLSSQKALLWCFCQPAQPAAGLEGRVWTSARGPGGGHDGGLAGGHRAKKKKIGREVGAGQSGQGRGRTPEQQTCFGGDPRLQIVRWRGLMGAFQCSSFSWHRNSRPSGSQNPIFGFISISSGKESGGAGTGPVSYWKPECVRVKT